MELGGGEEAGGERGLRDVGELPAGGYDLGLVGAKKGGGGVEWVSLVVDVDVDVDVDVGGWVWVGVVILHTRRSARCFRRHCFSATRLLLLGVELNFHSPFGGGGGVGDEIFHIVRSLQAGF